MIERQILQEIDRFSATLPRPSPKGTCLDRSHQFVEHLGDKGHLCASVQFGSLGEENHCWVEVWGDDFACKLVDFTADQFGGQYPPLIVDSVERAFDVFPYQYDDLG